MADAHTAHAPDADKYYIPHGSKWPIIGSVALFTTMLGAASLLNGVAIAPFIFWTGLALVLFMFYCWFGTVIGENEAGMYNEEVDRSFRMGMMWFIFSEVMFFGAFFGALFYARRYALPAVADLDHAVLWPVFKGVWPSHRLKTAGPGTAVASCRSCPTAAIGCPSAGRSQIDPRRNTFIPASAPASAPRVATPSFAHSSPGAVATNVGAAITWTSRPARTS